MGSSEDYLDSLLKSMGVPAELASPTKKSSEPVKEAPAEKPVEEPVKEENVPAEAPAVSSDEAALDDLLKQMEFASPQYREGAKLLNELARAEKHAPEETEEYIVQSGDSLIRLARNRRISTVRLAAR